MKILAVAIMIGPLMLSGAAFAAAGQSSLVLGSGVAVQLAADESSKIDRDTYTQKAQDEVREWQRKLHDLGEKTAAKGKEAGTAAENDLSRAWTRTEAESRKLQAAGAEGWESAKISFEKASHELAETWHKSHPDDK